MDNRRRVLRYPLPCSLNTNKEFTIELPVGSEILNCKIKPYESHASIWALVPMVNMPFIEKRKFLILGTGHKYEGNNKLKHVDIIFEEESDNCDCFYVWHIFEILDEQLP
jgi:hypothetical protein